MHGSGSPTEPLDARRPERAASHLLQVALMVALGAIKRACLLYSCVVIFRSIGRFADERLAHSQSYVALRLTVAPDRTSILTAKTGGRMLSPKDAVHVSERDQLWIERYSNGLRVVSDALIGRVGELSAAIPHDSVENPGELSEVLLGVPESAHAECHSLKHRRRDRRRQHWAGVVEHRHPDAAWDTQSQRRRQQCERYVEHWCAPHTLGRRAGYHRPVGGGCGGAGRMGGSSVAGGRSFVF